MNRKVATGVMIAVVIGVTSLPFVSSLWERWQLLTQPEMFPHPADIRLAADLDLALRAYEVSVGERPPVYDEGKFRHHVEQRWGHSEEVIASLKKEGLSIDSMDASESLVFWLYGYVTRDNRHRTPHYDFFNIDSELNVKLPSENFSDRDGDGWMEFYGTSQLRPVVFLLHSEQVAILDHQTDSILTFAYLKNAQPQRVSFQ